MVAVFVCIPVWSTVGESALARERPKCAMSTNAHVGFADSPLFIPFLFFSLSHTTAVAEPATSLERESLNFVAPYHFQGLFLSLQRLVCTLSTKNNNTVEQLVKLSWWTTQSTHTSVCIELKSTLEKNAAFGLATNGKFHSGRSFEWSPSLRGRSHNGHHQYHHHHCCRRFHRRCRCRYSDKWCFQWWRCCCCCYVCTIAGASHYHSTTTTGNQQQ
jgi:hypothetical protein